ncbi:hypothetical protein Glove_624g2 [Diversispora epigaea]|uniref:Protein kinase domain-containing protein n=1 Tax=Diversispora epigaea TaxID=1348612 RepID=A0A397GE36_9GLOM|nr:hypothetical protein Glove_624g2 [Diversispora epigaea]
MEIYSRFKDFKQIGKGRFGIIHYVRWIDGFIREWERYGKSEVALKKFDNFMAIHLKTQDEVASIQFYGIMQDPETLSYIMVLKYASDGNFQEYLKINFNNINWFQKLDNLYRLSLKLMNIHLLDIVHQDLHPGNILSSILNLC